MQLCQNARTTGRISSDPGAPSSNDSAKRKVGPIIRIARNPAHVINHSKNLCHKVYGRCSVAVSRATGDVVAELTSVLYRLPRRRTDTPVAVVELGRVTAAD